MTLLKTINLFLFFLTFIIGYAQPVGQIGVHDPVMMKHKGTYYLFATGHGISVASSTDLTNWKKEKPVFSNAPQWAIEKVPSFKGHIWAPDIAFYKGKYYLYYSVSAFGKNTSCIGVATNVTLDNKDPKFKWEDHGLVIESIPGRMNWNAIDPNFILDDKGQPYLSFGSFWDGIKLVKLTKDALHVDEDIHQIPTIASRKKSSTDPKTPSIDNNSKDAGTNAIEAPFIFKHTNGYYYLFLSIDYCCKGVNSTYKMIVGRSKKLAGPYLDDQGNDLVNSGGKIVLEGNANWHGVGHNAVMRDGKQDYLIFHGYDANDRGKSKLLVKKITWDKAGWPVVDFKD